MKNKRFFTHYPLSITHYFRRRRGFTLLEILVVVSLVGLITAAASGIFSYAIRSNQKSRAILEVKQVGDGAMAKMANLIRQAGFEPSICDAAPYTSDTITVINGDVSNTFTCSAVGILSNGDKLTGSELVIDGYESCFTCYSDVLGGPAVIEIAFTLRKESGNPVQDFELDFITSVSLRNY